MRSLWSLLALASAIASPAAAFHTVFDVTVDRFSVDGNVYGANDGVPDLTDDFDVPSIVNWRTPYGSSHVAGGRLHITNPGSHFPGPDGLSLDLSEVTTNLFSLSRHSGNFDATAVFDAVVPPEGHFYHFTLYTFGGGQYFNELFGVDIQTVGGTTLIEQHLVVLDLNRGVYQTVRTESQAVTAAEMTGQLHLRLHYDGVAGTVHSSFSVDGGTTFQAPFSSAPIFTEGRESGLFILGADPRVSDDTATTSTTTTTSATTTTTKPGLGRAVRGRLLLRPSGFRMDLWDTAIDVGAGHRSNDDPIEHGGSVRIVSPTAGLDVTLPMQRSGWARRGLPEAIRGYTYTSPPLSPRPIKVAVIRRARTYSDGSRKPGSIFLKARGDLSGFLAADPMPVTFVVSTGDRSQCVTFTTDGRSFRQGKSLRSNVASSPEGCPP